MSELLLALILTTAAAQKPQLLRPCEKDSEDLQKAIKALEAIDSSIRELEPSAFDAMAMVLKRLAKLDKSPCFEFDAPGSVTPDSPLALKRFWENGGHKARSSRLTFGVDGQRTLWSAPSMERTLSRETHPRSPLLPLLCGVADAECLAETTVWRYRAELAFEHFLTEKRRTTQQENGGAIITREIDDCAEKARHHAPEKRLYLWRRCGDGDVDHKVKLPLGGMHAPQDGWLVLEGRRGHYGFCDEVRAYHMGTGSAYVVQDCSDLALKAGGLVDHRKTDENRKLEIKTGTVSREAIREAAWMILIAEHVVDRAYEAVAKTVPEDFDLVVPREHGLNGFTTATISASSSGSTAQTTLQWSFQIGPKKLASGDLTWPYDLDNPEWSHVLDLIKAAEESLKVGCATVAPPALFTKSAPALSAHRLDTDKGSLSVASERIRRAWSRLVSETRPCSE